MGASAAKQQEKAASYAVETSKQPPKSNGSVFDMTAFSSTAKLAEGDPEKPGLPAYDPFQERDVSHPNSDVGALAHLLKSSLGSGILAMPLAFRNAGLAFGMVATLVVGYICTYSVHMLVNCSQVLSQRVRQPSLTFAGTAGRAFETGPPALRRYSRAAHNAVDVLLLATYYSMVCVYIVFIATSLRQVLVFYFPEDANFDVRLYIVATAPLLLPLCMIRQLKFLAPFSAVANLLICVSFAITLYYIFTDLPPLSSRDSFSSIGQLPLFFSTVIFAVEGIGVVLPVENSMRNPTHFLGCPGVLNIAMGIVIGLYAVIGFFGYLKYGDETEGSITLNLPSAEPLAQAVKVLIAVATIFSYGLQFYVPTEIVMRRMKPRLPHAWANPAEFGYRFLTVMLTVAVAAAVPDLGPIITLVGAVFASTLGLLCPAVIDSATFWETARWWRHARNAFVCVFSLFALVTGVYASLLDIIDTY
ncbi:proton-coupled amino acid transporter-like protein CG1139 isoform X1 [Schistocerca nitens]|uniref:proton-coupled amino acid transporter-like protein CG1139 isoform X1 n=1 Tax=Schistocerca nitens TaxID=7011 RepID=UPI00211939E9|nr:proton-coupled amino acid transporter-like protein CG1139 isoform X1 [Schistocerca nitens]XP_049810736.1 proton-coupled amino acid transporter-like protein CG1139 isoform X1 [Schistocerca nitens]